MPRKCADNGAPPSTRLPPFQASRREPYAGIAITIGDARPKPSGHPPARTSRRPTRASSSRRLAAGGTPAVSPRSAGIVKQERAVALSVSECDDRRARRALQARHRYSRPSANDTSAPGTAERRKGVSPPPTRARPSAWAGTALVGPGRKQRCRSPVGLPREARGHVSKNSKTAPPRRRGLTGAGSKRPTHSRSDHEGTLPPLTVGGDGEGSRATGVCEVAGDRRLAEMRSSS
jgi:hypothetical protein